MGTKITIVFSGGQFLPLYTTFEMAQKVIKELSEILAERNKKEPFNTLYHLDTVAGKAAVIDTQSIVGVYLSEIPKDNQAEIVKNQNFIMKLLGKHLGEDEDWRKDV